MDLPITRAEIHVDSVLGDQRMADKLEEWDFMLDKATKIAYVRITAFTETTVAELTKVVDQLQKEGMRGLVVDLRGNPGGLLKAAVETSSLFLPEGKKVVTTRSRDRKEDVYEAHKERGMPPGGTDYPITILINRWSASASEIVASALQDHLRAIIIGERSYGKGSVQNIIQLENGTSALKLTTASYWRPSGKNIHRFPDSKEEDEWGVRPNEGFEVKLTDEERIEYYKYRRDRDIVRRAGQPAKAPETSKTEKGEKGAKAKEPFRDRVLDRAVDYIRGELKRGNAAAQAAPPVGQKVFSVPAALRGNARPDALRQVTARGRDAEHPDAAFCEPPLNLSTETSHPSASPPAPSGTCPAAPPAPPSAVFPCPPSPPLGCPGRCSC